MRLALALLAFATLAAPARAAVAPRALLAHRQDAVLAGETLLYTRVQGRALTIYSRPLAGDKLSTWPLMAMSAALDPYCPEKDAPMVRSCVTA